MSTPRRPNVLIVLTDDQRAGAFEYMPVTNRLFRDEGRTFTNAFATTPLCCPSRASILTGLYAHNHGVVSAAEESRSESRSAQELMIQKPLQASGYTTALYGKFLNSWDVEESPAYLDEWAIFSKSAPTGYRGGTWNVNGTLQRIEQYSTSYIRDLAVSFLQRREEEDERPWFLYLATAAPHIPYEPASRYRRAEIASWRANPAVREADRSDKPDWVPQGAAPDQAQVTRDKQLRTLMSVDDLVARLMRKLSELGEARDTLAVYTSDNGYLWKEHSLHGKRWPYIQSAQIPLMIRWPGRIKGGIRDQRIVANIDIAPTVADIANVSLPQTDGRSLLSHDRRNRLLLEYFRTRQISIPPTWASTITADYQYIEYHDDAGLTFEREYYDLRDDPWQLVNVLGDDDLRNDPLPADMGRLAVELRKDRSCRGSDECP